MAASEPTSAGASLLKSVTPALLWEALRRRRPDLDSDLLDAVTEYFSQKAPKYATAEWSASDLVQYAWKALLNYADRERTCPINKAINPFLHWRFRGAVSEALRHHRQGPLVVELNEPTDDGGGIGIEEVVDPTGGPSEKAAQRDDAHILIATVKQLPPDYYTVIVLRYWENLAYGEIAERLGLTELQVTEKLRHAKNALRQNVSLKKAQA